MGEHYTFKGPQCGGHDPVFFGAVVAKKERF